MTNIAKTFADQTGQLVSFSLIEAQGKDAFEFLQNQLTQDLQKCSTTEAQYAAWASPKGRLLASFLIWQADADRSRFFLLLKTDIAEKILKRLQMFVLRSDVKLSLNTLPVSGLILNKGQTLPEGFPEQPLGIATTNSGFAIRCHNHEDAVRYYVTGQETEEIAGFDAAWQALDVCTGLAWVDASNQEKFIPQSINYDALHIVSFSKGCYPGQEVVARSHYRGTLKRRSIIATCSGNQAVAEGDVYVAGDDQAVGQVVNHVYSEADNTTYLLVEMRLEALQDNEQLHLAQPDGPLLEWKMPPYSLEKPEN